MVVGSRLSPNSINFSLFPSFELMQPAFEAGFRQGIQMGMQQRFEGGAAISRGLTASLLETAKEQILVETAQLEQPWMSRLEDAFF
jgi:hypothetical protein